MDGFNFFINVDECLNMSNFEMFFYQLQYAHKFYVVNATFQDEVSVSDEISGVKSIQDAVHGIRNYIGQSSFLIGDYRLVFSIRQPYKKEVVWRESVLYRLLKIYYCLQNAKLFIKTKDHADKNVTVILLYDVNNTMDEKDIQDVIEDNTRDIPLLMDYMGVDWQDKDKYPEEKDIAEALIHSEEFDTDPVTKQFIKEYYDWFKGHKLDESFDSEKKWGEIERPRAESRLPEAQLREARIYNRVNNLTTFILGLIGQYCVFTKSISTSTGDHRLALLSIVDYITTGLIDNEEDGQQEYSNANLKQKARDNWKQARDDRTVWKKYGRMMQIYEARMQDRLISIEGRISSDNKPLNKEYEPPQKISQEFNGSGYEKKIREILKEYRESLHLGGGEVSWEETRYKLEQLVGELERSLENYAESLSDSYRRELAHRSAERKKQIQDKEIYNRDQIDDMINDLQRRKQGLLDVLKKQRMTPQVRYQDQLNVNSAIRSCSQKMSYYLQRRSQITIAAFATLLLGGGGFVLLSHLVLQESLLSNPHNILGMVLSALAAAAVMILSWGAPGAFYRSRINQALNILQEELERYTHGYTELAHNFEEYMNTINELDVINNELEELQRLRVLANKDSRMLLWHKDAIERHLNKCNFFHLLYEGILPDEYSEGEIPLDLEKDVINNRFYWPQENNGGR